MSSKARMVRRKLSVCRSPGESSTTNERLERVDDGGFRGRISNATVDGCAIRFSGLGRVLEAAHRTRQSEFECNATQLTIRWKYIQDGGDQRTNEVVRSHWGNGGSMQRDRDRTQRKK